MPPFYPLALQPRRPPGRPPTPPDRAHTRHPATARAFAGLGHDRLGLLLGRQQALDAVLAGGDLHGRRGPPAEGVRAVQREPSPATLHLPATAAAVHHPSAAAMSHRKFERACGYLKRQ